MKKTIPAREAITKNMNKAQKKYIRKHKSVKSELRRIKPTSPTKEIKTLNTITNRGCFTFL